MGFEICKGPHTFSPKELSMIIVASLEAGRSYSRALRLMAAWRILLEVALFWGSAYAKGAQATRKVSINNR